MILVMGFAALPVYGALPTGITLMAPDIVTATDGGSGMFLVKVKNDNAAPADVTIEASVVDAGKITLSRNSQTVTVNGGSTSGAQFTAYVQGASEGFYSVNFKAYVVGDDANFSTVTGTVRVQASSSPSIDTTPVEKVYMPSVTISRTLGTASVDAGVTNNMSIHVENTGDCTLKGVEVSLSSLPEGLTLEDQGSTLTLGRLEKDRKGTVVFKLLADSEMESKNYPITVQVSGYTPNNSKQSFSSTIYVPVSAAASSSKGSLEHAAITSVSLPEQVTAGSEFTLSFTVENQGDAEIKDLTVSAEGAEGMTNKTQNVFALSSLAGKSSKSYTITYYTDEEMKEKNYPVKITVTGSGAQGGAISQYAGILVRETDDAASGDIKTPQLMINQYSYGDASVRAGSEFTLNLGLLNTSGKSLNNIKVSLSAESGAFVPVDSSSSFFIDHIGSKGQASKSMVLSVSPQAEQKTTAVTITMNYEDGDGNAYSATDTISIPVTQDTRLVVDDIVPPYECYAGNMGSAEIEFYNMGKTTLRNLRINAEGDFDIVESNSYYAGNMESGRSDSYSFTFIPRQTGPMEGKVTFSYEDANGAQQLQEAPFVFEVVEMPVWDDPYMMDEPVEEKTVPKALIIFGIVVAAIVITILVLRHRRKVKMNKALAIADLEDQMEMEAESSQNGNA